MTCERTRAYIHPDVKGSKKGAEHFSGNIDPSEKKYIILTVIIILKLQLSVHVSVRTRAATWPILLLIQDYILVTTAQSLMWCLMQAYKE